MAVMLSRDYRFFDIARSVAHESDFRTKIGAIAVYGGRVIASAASSEKTSTLQYKYNRYRDFSVDGADCLPKLHAEIGLVAKLKKMRNVDMRRVSVYVYRICKSRESGLARPCKACMSALRDIGIYRIYYTTDFGVAMEVIDKV